MLIILGLGSILGCREGPLSSNVCTEELRVHLTPFDTTVAVGTQFYATISLSSCGGRERLTDNITWASSNATVATVEAAPIFMNFWDYRALVTTRGAGTANIVPTGAKYHTLPGAKVTVR